MKSFKYLVVAMTLMVFVGVQSAFALTLNHSAPTFSGTADDNDFNNEISLLWDEVIADLNGEIGGIPQKMPKLGSAFATAGTFSNHAATQRAYQGYDLFAVTVGTMAGGQLPSLDFSTYGDIGDDLKNGQDLEAGIGWQAWAVQVGLNSKFLLEGLYLGVKFGGLNLSQSVGDHSLIFEYISFGALANYQIFKERSFTGMLVWRGLSVGSGLLYQKNSTGFIYDAGDFTSSSFYNYGGQDIYINASPELALTLDSHLVTIPLEVTTSVRLLYFLNLSVGLGADINFGKSDLVASVKSDASATNLPAGITQETAGSISTSAGAKGANPKAFAAKAMANIGFGIGPVIVDFPLTYYFNNGFSIGLSAGFVW